MDKVTPELIWYILLFFAPGFLASFWIQRYVPKQQGDSDGKNLLSYITLSVMCYLPFIVWMVIKNELPYVRTRSIFYWLTGTTLLAPIAISMFFGFAIQFDWVGKFFRLFGLKPKRFTATAWEEFFSHNPAVAVIVTFVNGNQVAGVFVGSEATASSDPGERDLFLPYTCQVVGTKWTLTEHTAGILIKASQIAHLEFFSLNQLASRAAGTAGQDSGEKAKQVDEKGS